eukprot:g5372.t1
MSASVCAIGLGERAIDDATLMADRAWQGREGDQAQHTMGGMMAKKNPNMMAVMSKKTKAKTMMQSLQKKKFGRHRRGVLERPPAAQPQGRAQEQDAKDKANKQAQKDKADKAEKAKVAKEEAKTKAADADTK